MDMEPPVISKPIPASTAELPLDHTNKLFGIVYITLTGVIDTIVPAAGPWSWVVKSMPYLIKLAPILWWALPTQSATRQFPNTSNLANQGWFPDKIGNLFPVKWVPDNHVSTGAQMNTRPKNAQRNVSAAKKITLAEAVTFRINNLEDPFSKLDHILKSLRGLFRRGRAMKSSGSQL
ncbi:hypothetical protein DSO57_1028433 [Entomophthora muscae]|uniref:Uncharacterized protein n=1 Tax=Entomophthora muscae TaxID=34485 RepID=A0ACC2TNZ4_9FUNG|nr:hypothetical protein DSO57_1028433 [Entomophthora muscae]